MNIIQPIPSVTGYGYTSGTVAKDIDGRIKNKSEINLMGNIQAKPNSLNCVA